MRRSVSGARGKPLPTRKTGLRSKIRPRSRKKCAASGPGLAAAFNRNPADQRKRRVLFQLQFDNPKKWRSHGRAIDVRMLRGEEIKLMIEYLEAVPALCRAVSIVRKYFELLEDYMNWQQLISFVHTKECF